MVNNFPIKELKASHRGVNVGVDVTRNRAINPKDFINPPSFFGWAMRHGLSDPPPIAIAADARGHRRHAG